VDGLRSAQRVWYERVWRRWRLAWFSDPVAQELGHEMKRAVADAGTYEEKIERMQAVEDRIGDHFGIGPRPR
jgi:hypothetical protein